MNNNKEKGLISNTTQEQEKVILIGEEKQNSSNKDIKIKQSSKKEETVFKKKIYVDTPLRIFVLAGFIFVFAFLSLIFLKKGLETKTYSSLYYNERSTLNYKVYLKPNPYFSESYLDKGNQYIASLIDYIDADFNYDFSASNQFNYQYRYTIKADVTVNEKGDTSKVLYRSSDVLVPEKTLQYDGSNNFSIRENLKIDYDKYNSVVSSFKKDYSLALESQLKVTLYVFMNGTYKEIKQPISSSQTLTLNIPLTEQTISIGMNYKDVNDASVVEEYSNVEPINIVFFALFGVALIVSLVLTVKLVRFLNKIRVKGTEYDRILGTILKDYEGIVARVKKVPDFNGRTVIELESFDEILDISEKLDKPILFIEMHKHQKSWFIIVNHNEIYKYSLKLVDVDKASNEKKN